MDILVIVWYNTIVRDDDCKWYQIKTWKPAVLFLKRGFGLMRLTVLNPL